MTNIIENEGEQHDEYSNIMKRKLQVWNVKETIDFLHHGSSPTNSQNYSSNGTLLTPGNTSNDTNQT